MKPVKLTISGWGPYREKEEIDFEKLRGIFLITGPTGAGKTTIFDAITYALYGELSGSLRGKTTVRSDFADGNTETFVEFTMEHGGQQYRIRRNPEYQRPGKRKSAKNQMTTEKEKAVLWAEDGSVLEGNREVTAKLRELLRLDLKQFRQISMIAQGEFAQLLHAGSEEKLKIFREIFDTSIYELFGRLLKQKAAALEKTVSEYLHRMQEDVRLFSSEDERYLELIAAEPHPYQQIAQVLEQIAKEAKEEAKETQQALNGLEEEIRKLQAQIALMENINERFGQLEKKKEQLSVLEAQKEQMQQLFAKLEHAQAADRVLEVDQKLQQVREDLQRQRRMTEEKEAELKRLTGEVEALKPAAERETKIEQCFIQMDTVRMLREQELKIRQQLLSRQKQLEEAQKRYLEAEEQVKCCRQQYELSERLARHAMIGIVASMVQPGQPCPVCGAMEHPRIAQIPADVPDQTQLEAQKEKLEEAQQLLLTFHGQAKAALELAESQKKEAKTAAQALAEAEKMYKGLRLELAEVEQILDIPEGVGAFHRQMKRFHEMEASLAEKKQTLQQLKESMLLYEERSRKQEVLLSEMMQQQGFAESREWKAALMSKAEQAALSQSLQHYREQTVACQEVITHLQEELAGKEVSDPVPYIRKQLQKKQDSSVLSQKKQQCLLQKEQAEKTARSLLENLKKSGEAQERYGVVKDLENAASGDNARRLVFEQYVLAGYFDDILHAANLRLRQMSDGRYELFRVGKISDGRKKDSLEIEVMDYYTGKRRSVRTLSGGETFKASLALALGLSDAVCAANGGIKVETLFIDEGFGALDAQSLDQACTTLMSLTGDNRLIGIISHVGELKERIPLQIQVEKQTLGSRIRVRRL